MDGNGTVEDPTQVPETPAPPPWMHDYVPASVIYDCQGPDCDQSARAYLQATNFFVAAGWQAMDQRPFCSWLCVARYAALRAQDQIETIHTEAREEALPLGGRKRTRHN